jgi:copper chaperone CopZ
VGIGDQPQGVQLKPAPPDHRGDGLHEATMRVEGLHCEGCCDALQGALGAIAGVEHVNVAIDDSSRATGTATVRGSAAALDEKLLMGAMASLGKTAVLWKKELLTSDVASGKPVDKPLHATEREELEYLRKRVAQLEAAISSLGVALAAPRK